MERRRLLDSSNRTSRLVVKDQRPTLLFPLVFRVCRKACQQDKNITRIYLLKERHVANKQTLTHKRQRLSKQTNVPKAVNESADAILMTAWHQRNERAIRVQVLGVQSRNWRSAMGAYTQPNHGVSWQRRTWWIGLRSWWQVSVVNRTTLWHCKRLSVLILRWKHPVSTQRNVYTRPARTSRRQAVVVLGINSIELF